MIVSYQPWLSVEETQRTGTMHALRFGCTGKEVIVHADDHRHEDDRVVREVQLEPRNEKLNDGGRDRRAEQRVTSDNLPLQQRMLDVMPELDHERREPPGPRPTHKAGRSEEHTSELQSHLN